MYETMMAMKESVKNLKEENAAQAKDIIAMQKLVKDTVDSKATDLTSDIAVNTEAIEKLDKDTEAQLNQIGVDLVRMWCA